MWYAKRMKREGRRKRSKGRQKDSIRKRKGEKVREETEKGKTARGQKRTVLHTLQDALLNGFHAVAATAGIMKIVLVNQ